MINVKLNENSLWYFHNRGVAQYDSDWPDHNLHSDKASISIQSKFDQSLPNIMLVINYEKVGGYFLIHERMHLLASL